MTAPVERYVLPASFGQERLWFMQLLVPSSAAYNMAATVRIEGPLDVEALVAGIAGIVERHEVLRTTLGYLDGRLVQLVEPTVGIGSLVKVIDLADADDIDNRIAAIRRERAFEPFDLTSGPLVRVTVIRLRQELHELLVSLHHIVADGLSIGILLGELSLLYGANLVGSPSPLPPLPIQYGDFAAWQREIAATNGFDADLDHWRRQLADAPPSVRLPVRPAGGLAMSAPVESVQIELDADVMQPLSALARAERSTTFAAVTAVFAVLLARYSGDTDLCLGTPVAGRPLTEADPLIGFFVNMVILRCNLSGDPSFRTFLKRTSSTVRDAVAHQGAPFEMVVQALKPGRETERTPLFHVGLTIVPAAPPLHLDGVRVQLEELPAPAARSDLWLSLEENGNRLRGNLLYRSDLFEHATVERMARHLERLARTAVERPDMPLSHLRLTDDDERAENIALATPPGPQLPEPAVAHALVEAQARRTPDAVALEFEGETLTYGELDDRAGRLAADLRLRGVGTGTVVGISFERSIEMVVSILATLKAGGAYLPLEPDFPATRLLQYVDDAKPALVLASTATAEAMAALGVSILLVDDLTALDNVEPLASGSGDISGDDLAYVVFTSGSTGQPKGVAGTHRGLVNHILRIQDLEPLDETDCVLQKVPLGFDVSAREIFWALASGARLSLAKPGGHQNAAYLIRHVERVSATVLHFVPSMLKHFVDALAVGNCPTLRLVVCGGEVLSGALQQRFAEQLDARLVNVYGPTEAAIDVTLHRCDGSSANPPIGRPLENCHLHVLDSLGEPVAVGVPGELHIGGAPVARGYVNRPDLTADRFIRDPFSGVSGATLYRTGDLVRRREDGALEYIGRVDNQVKVRGVRIELEEVEAAIQRHDAVRHVAAVVREREDSRRIVAYVSARDGASVDVTELRAHVLRQLPDYYCPAAFVILDDLPQAPNGKLDRSALPDIDRQRPAIAAPCVAPRTDTERSIHAIWQSVLELDELSVHDKFFELGGDSLLLLQAWFDIDQQFPEAVELDDLFEHTSVAAVAIQIDARRGTAIPTGTTYTL